MHMTCHSWHGTDPSLYGNATSMIDLSAAADNITLVEIKPFELAVLTHSVWSDRLN
jgi:hypothetical protein